MKVASVGVPRLLTGRRRQMGHVTGGNLGYIPVKEEEKWVHELLTSR